jgi:hypothetical protein
MIRGEKMLPSKVKIGGIEYSVEEKEVVIINGNSNYSGKIDYHQATIEILKDSPEQRKEETLIHEILHGVFYESGCVIEDEEEIVSKASRVLYQVLKDNKLTFEKGE